MSLEYRRTKQFEKAGQTLMVNYRVGLSTDEGYEENMSAEAWLSFPPDYASALTDELNRRNEPQWPTNTVVYVYMICDDPGGRATVEDAEGRSFPDFRYGWRLAAYYNYSVSIAKTTLREREILRGTAQMLLCSVLRRAIMVGALRLAESVAVEASGSIQANATTMDIELVRYYEKLGFKVLARNPNELQRQLQNFNVPMGAPVQTLIAKCEASVGTRLGKIQKQSFAKRSRDDRVERQVRRRE